MRFSLRVKLSAAFVAVTLLLFFIVSVLANVLLERQFRQYVIAKQNQKITDTVALIKTRYDDWGGKWDAGGVETIGMNALGDGLILHLTDNSGKTVWNAREHNNGMCTAILQHMAQNMQSRNPSFQGGYADQEVAIIANGATVGRLLIGYYGPYFYTDSDIKFLETLNSLLIWAAVLSSAAALGFGMFMARRLTLPITQVTGMAARIASGDYSARVHDTAATKEITALTHAINSLADTLSKQETLRKRLTADVAHELRTPIATLQSHLEAMIDGIWQADERRLKSCHEEIIRISKMVGDLEKLAQYESENLQLEIARFDLSALIGRVTTNFEGQYLEKGVRLAFQHHEEMIEGDSDKLSQVAINLLSNALKYTGEGGVVTVQLTGEEDCIKLSVRDTGTGIPPEDLPHIFERFYRTDKSRNRLTGGAGIGLTITKAIVEAHGGSIAAVSTPGEGSRFTVTLPRYR